MIAVVVRGVAQTMTPCRLRVCSHLPNRPASEKLRGGAMPPVLVAYRLYNVVPVVVRCVAQMTTVVVQPVA